MALEQSYTSQPAGTPSVGSGGVPQQKPDDYWTLAKVKKCYSDYLFSKRQEIDEQIEARRYYHGSQWTQEQIDILKKRKQPAMTFNRVARKIDGVIGLIERLRQDPKAYPRTPQHEEGAELATAAIRYVLDEQRWKEKSPVCASDGAIDGIGGVSLVLEQGDQGDPEVGFDTVDIPSFFYDPRSYKDDFSDALFQGEGKWVDVDIARSTYREPIDGEAVFTGGQDSELRNNTDRELRWFSTEGVQKRLRIVDIWYRHAGGWCWCIFTGSGKIAEGKSYLQDEKGKDYCKYIMFSGNVDQDGDRYGFPRGMKSAQDGINAKQSRMQHMLHSKRLFVRSASVADVEKVRAEYARNDGVVVTVGPVNESVKADDVSFDFTGMAKMLELNLNEIENFGPNPALIGQGVENRSGRAIALLQQAGMAELGPFILAYRGWKLRVYRGLLNAVQRHWKAERWIRVTDNEGLAQFIQVNGVGVDPRTGKPGIINAIGSLDVDVIMDEGPDSMTLEAASFETLQALGPAFIEKYPDIAIELSPLDTRTKKMFKQKQQEAAQNPMNALQQAGAKAKVHQAEADAGLKEAQTAKTLQEAHMAPLQALMDGQGQGQMPEAQEYQLPPELQNAQAMADIRATNANADAAQAKAMHTQQQAALSPQQMMFDQANIAADRIQAQADAEADRAHAAQLARTRSTHAQR